MKRRIFISGMPNDISEQDIKNRFKSFGTASNIHICHKQKTLIFFDIENETLNYKQLIQLYNNTRWKQETLRVEVAKLDFLTRLERERSSKPEAKLKLKFKKTCQKTKFKIRLKNGRQVVVDPKKYSKHKRFKD